MTSLKVAAVAAALIGTAGIGQAATIDFSNFAEGAALGMNTNLGGGISAGVSALGGVDQAVIFDTADGTVSTDNDPDLTSNFKNAEDPTEVRDFGKVLIVQENLTGGPDDAGAGGSLTLAFDLDIILTSLSLVDARLGTTAELFLAGNLVQSFVLDEINESDTENDPTDNAFTFLDFGSAVGDEIVVTFTASGGIGEFEASLAAVPVPASLPLLAGGFGLMAFMRRHRSAK